MKNTIQILIPIKNEQIREELIAQLSELDFDAFEEKEEELAAFIGEDKFNKQALEKILIPYNLAYARKAIKDQNWNTLWENNFPPVLVNDFCAVRAHFHLPFVNMQHDIIITPKMSFGTGHHATTFMMISEMSKINFVNKQVADFGTGTGVLAILAEKLGSNFVLAIDNDDWSIENSKENIEKNNCSNIIIKKAESFLPHQKFDIILANINKHIILSNLGGLLFGLQVNGELLLSGLLKEDEQDIVEAFTLKGCTHKSTVEKNNWICLLFKKVLL